MKDEIWLVVRRDGKDMHRTSYSSRKIRAYKTESMAKSQAKRWNKGNKRPSELRPGDVGHRVVISSQFDSESGTLVLCEHGDVAIMFDDGDVYHLDDSVDITFLD